MAGLNVNYSDFFNNWKDRNLSEDVIRVELHQNGMDNLQIEEMLRFYKKKRNEEKQTIGFILTAIGAFLGFLSCLFTMLDLIPEMRGFMLYGLTTIGLIVIFIGLFLVFE